MSLSGGPMPELGTRGERNNNPGNLRHESGIDWRGLADPPQDAGGYCRFLGPQDGIRALARDLHTKWGRGLRTIRRIVGAYAPPTENDTPAYVADVAQRLAKGPDDPLDLGDETLLRDFVVAVIVQENGRCRYAPDLIAAAVKAALPPA